MVATNIKITQIQLSWPLWRAEEWCHHECFVRWCELDHQRKGILGGHVHYDSLKDEWRTPNPAPPLTEPEIHPLGPNGELPLELIH
jgi:hypothetical protein